MSKCIRLSNSCGSLETIWWHLVVSGLARCFTQARVTDWGCVTDSRQPNEGESAEGPETPGEAQGPVKPSGASAYRNLSEIYPKVGPSFAQISTWDLLQNDQNLNWSLSTKKDKF